MSVIASTIAQSVGAEIPAADFSLEPKAADDEGDAVSTLVTALGAVPAP